MTNLIVQRPGPSDASTLDGMDSTAFTLLAGRAGGQTLVGGTAPGDALRLRATASSADGAIIFESDPTTEVARILADGKFGIGTEIPQATLEVGGVPGASVGGFPSGNLHVTGQSALVNANAVITGHNLFGGNKQLWYLGSASGSSDDILFINRQTGSMGFFTSNTQRILIDSAGLVGIATAVPVTTLEIKNPSGLNATLRMTDTQVAHGMTALPVSFSPTPATDTYCQLQKLNSTSGGACLQGFSASGAIPGVEMRGIIGSASPTKPVITLIGSKKNGTTEQDIAAGETLLSVQNAGSQLRLLEVFGNGDVKTALSLEIDGDLNHDGSNVGFYGTAPVAKQTGVAVTAAAIHAALVNLGLIAA